MPALFIITLICTFTAVLTLAYMIFFPKTLGDREYDGYGRESRTPARRRFIVPATAGVIAALVLLLASLTMVPTREVGVVLSFGKPVGTLDNGIHWKAPWHRVVDMDGTIQTQDNTGDHRTEIRLGNQATAYVQNTLRWSIKTDGADDLYLDYRKFENIEGSLVKPELAAALNVAFATYDPLKTAEGTQSYDQMAKDVQARLQERVGDKIVIHSLIIPKVDFDDATQKRIDALQTEIGNTRIAEQARKTAEQTKLKNELLAKSVTPDINQANCLDIVREKGSDLPPGFSCVAGGGVLVNGK